MVPERNFGASRVNRAAYAEMMVVIQPERLAPPAGLAYFCRPLMEVSRLASTSGGTAADGAGVLTPIQVREALVVSTSPGRDHSAAQVYILCFVLAAYAAGMLTFAMSARGWGPLHADMTEAWAWGKEFQLGYGKHPMMSAWMAGAWFAVLPRTGWGYYLLSIANAGIGLAGVWMLAGVVVGGSGRLAAVLFLLLTPSYTLWALKFNANSALLSSWPWTAYFFLQSLRKGSSLFGALAGAAGAIALLTKYYSVVLIGALALTALLHPGRGRYFRSPAPYVTAVVGALVLAPHVWWLWQTHFGPVSYAISKTRYPLAETREHAVTAILGGYLSLALALTAFALAFGRESWVLLKRSCKAAVEPQAAWLICLAHGPVVVTLAAYLLANVRFTAAHLIPAFFAIPVALLAASGAQVTPAAVKRLALVAVVVWASMLAAAPVLAAYTFAHAQPESVEPRRELAVAATDLWRARFGRPLRYVAGSEPLATAATFYSGDAPSYVMLATPAFSPWATADALLRDGLLILCRAADRGCIDRARRLTGNHGSQYEIILSPRYAGRTAPAQTFAVFVVPPAEMDVPD
jgi:4-amino-4-deoxy-L-arabinose transferase-like glycosyltransferase